MKYLPAQKKNPTFIKLAIYGFTGMGLHAAWITLSLVWFGWHLTLVLFLALYASNIDKLVTRTMDEYNKKKALDEELDKFFKTAKTRETSTGENNS